MKHIDRLIITLALLLASTGATAANWFTMGENDTLRIAAGCDTVTVPVFAHFDGGVSSWTLTVTWPEGLEGIKVAEGPDMTVSYFGSQGEELSYDGAVTTSADFTIISSTITAAAYWPYGGSYIAYGHAMWPAGDYDAMFYLTFKVVNGFTGGEFNISGMVKGDNPFAGGVGNVLFNRKVTVIVTRVPGDINGDGRKTIADVTALINLLLTDAAYDPVADITGDGKVSIADVTALINQLLTRH